LLQLGKSEAVFLLGVGVLRLVFYVYSAAEKAEVRMNKELLCGEAKEGVNNDLNSPV